MNRKGISTAIIVLGVVIVLALILMSNNLGNIGINPMTSTTTTIKSCEELGLPADCNTPPPTYPIKIISSEVLPNNPKVGDSLIFNVTFQNIGNAPVYYVYGCGSSLSISIEEKTDILNVEKIPQPTCLCAVRLTRFNPNEIANAVSPNCADGYSLKAIKRGDIVANLTILWGSNQNDLDSSTSIFYTVKIS